MLHYEKLRCWATQSPNDLFLRLGKETPLTVRDVFHRVNRLAHLLLSKGQRPGNLIGIALNSELDHFIAELAINAIHCAIVPIDPTRTYDSRLCAQIQVILDKEQLGQTLDLLLSDVSLLEVASINDAIEVLSFQTGQLDEITADMSALPVEIQLPPPDDNGTHLSYLTFSSGSKGTPKCIRVSHEAEEGWVESIAENYKVGERILNCTSRAYDPAHWSLLVALITRSELVLGSHYTSANYQSDEISTGFHPLIHLIRELHITSALIIPTLAKTIRLLDVFRDLPLMTLQSTGEMADPALAKQWLESGRVFINLFGSSELGFGGGICRLTDPKELVESLPPIMPQKGVTWLVMRENEKGEWHRCLPGEKGELLVIKPNIYSYYSNDPLSAQTNFICLPNPDVPTQKILAFKEGVKLVELQSRDQKGSRYQLFERVKGNRYKGHGGVSVDIFPVEQALIAHENIIQAAIVETSPELSQDKKQHLALHLQWRNSQEPLSLLQLRQYLTKLQIHSTALPCLLYVYESHEWPILPTGKTDRERMAERPFSDSVRQSLQLPKAYQKIESEIQTIWEEMGVIHPTDVLAFENSLTFNAYGGHSLNLVTFIAKIEEKWGVSLTKSDLKYGECTVLDVARLIKGSVKGIGTGHSALLVQSKFGDNSKAAPLFLVPGITGEDESTFQKVIQSLSVGMRSVYVLRDPAYVFEDSADLDMDDLARLFRCAMRTVQPTGPLTVVGWSFGATLAWKIAIQEEGRDVPLENLLLIDQKAPYPGKISDVEPCVDLVEIVDLISTLSKYPAFDDIKIPVDSLSLKERIRGKDLRSQIQIIFQHVNADKSRMMLNVVQRNLIALSEYTLNFLAKKRMGSRIVSEEALHKTQVSVLAAEKTLEKTLNKSLFWELYVKEPYLTRLEVEGDHFSIFRIDKNIDSLASAIVKAIAPRSRAGSMCGVAREQETLVIQQETAGPGSLLSMLGNSEAVFLVTTCVNDLALSGQSRVLRMYRPAGSGSRPGEPPSMATGETQTGQSLGSLGPTNSETQLSSLGTPSNSIKRS